MRKAAKNSHSAEIITESELSTIAARINGREAQINTMMAKSLHLAALIGQDMNLVKESLHNGLFMDWCRDNCDIKQHQINRYMRLAREYPEYTDPGKCPSNLSINAALEMLRAPDDVIELINEAIADGEVVHQRTVRELCGKPSYSDNRPTGKPYTAPTVVQSNSVEAVVPRPEYFRLTQHACIKCMGRLLVRTIGKKLESICANCEDRHVVSDETELPCWCNKTLGDPKNGGYDSSVKATRKNLDKIFECVPNPDRSVVSNAIVVRERAYNPMQAQKQVRSAFTGNTMDYL